MYKQFTSFKYSQLFLKLKYNKKPMTLPDTKDDNLTFKYYKRSIHSNCSTNKDEPHLLSLQFAMCYALVRRIQQMSP